MLKNYIVRREEGCISLHPGTSGDMFIVELDEGGVEYFKKLNKDLQISWGSMIEFLDKNRKETYE